MAPRTVPWKWFKQRQESRTRNSLHQKPCLCSCRPHFFVNMSHPCSGLKLSVFSRWSVPWPNSPSNANSIVQEFTWSGDRWDKGRHCRALDYWVRGWRGMTYRRRKKEQEWEADVFAAILSFHQTSYVLHFSSGRDLCGSSLYPCYQDSVWHTMDS